MTLPDGEGFLASLLAALGASFHCAGMCGGFVLAAPGRARSRPGRLALAPPQALYHLGKTASYLFLGVLAGLGGRWISWERPLAGRLLAAAASVTLIAIGLRTLGIWPRSGGGDRARPRAIRVAPPRPLAEFGKAIAGLESPLRPLSLGVLSGWLPCPIVYAFLARGAATGSPLESALTLLALALGTAPVLIAVAWTGRSLSPLLRARMVRASGALLVLLGIYTAWRGFAAATCCVIP